MAFQYNAEINYPATLTSLQGICNTIFANTSCNYVGILDIIGGYFYYAVNSPQSSAISSFSASLNGLYSYGNPSPVLNTNGDPITITWFQNDNISKWAFRVCDVPSGSQGLMTFEFDSTYQNITQYLNWFGGVATCLNSSQSSIPSNQNISVSVAQNLAVNTWQQITYNYTVPLNTLYLNGGYELYNLPSCITPNSQLYTFTTPDSAEYLYLLIGINTNTLLKTGSPLTITSWDVTAQTFSTFKSYVQTNFPFITYIVEFLTSTSFTVYSQNLTVLFTTASVDSLNNFNISCAFTSGPATITTSFSNASATFLYTNAIANVGYSSTSLIDIAFSSIGTTLSLPSIGYTAIEAPMIFNPSVIFTGTNQLSIANATALPFIENYGGSTYTGTDSEGYFCFYLPVLIQGAHGLVPSMFLSTNGTTFTSVTTAASPSGTSNPSLFWFTPAFGASQVQYNPSGYTSTFNAGIRYNQYTKAESQQANTFTSTYGFKLKVSQLGIIYYQIFNTTLNLTNGGQWNVQSSNTSVSWNVYFSFHTTYSPVITYPTAATTFNSSPVEINMQPLSTFFNQTTGAFSKYQYISFEQTYPNAANLISVQNTLQLSQPIVDGNFHLCLEGTNMPYTSDYTAFGLTADPCANNSDGTNNYTTVPFYSNTFVIQMRSTGAYALYDSNGLLSSSGSISLSGFSTTVPVMEIACYPGQDLMFRVCGLNVSNTNDYPLEANYLTWIQLPGITSVNQLMGKYLFNRLLPIFF